MQHHCPRQQRKHNNYDEQDNQNDQPRHRQGRKRHEQLDDSYNQQRGEEQTAHDAEGGGGIRALPKFIAVVFFVLDRVAGAWGLDEVDAVAAVADLRGGAGSDAEDEGDTDEDGEDQFFPIHGFFGV